MQLSTGIAIERVPKWCSKPEHLLRVLAMIDHRLADSIHVAELAGAIAMSEFHFSRSFKRATGLAPHAFITHKRMERAKSLLRETSEPLIQVGKMVGFRRQAHFTDAFRKHVGITPGAYRFGGSAKTPAAPHLVAP
jgi:AraC family transcriptional regulator